MPYTEHAHRRGQDFPGQGDNIGGRKGAVAAAAVGADENGLTADANVRTRGGAATALAFLVLTAGVVVASTAMSQEGFAPSYSRDYNIYEPVNRFRAENPLNPVDRYAPDDPFNPVNRFDPDNPVNPINRYRADNPFNPVNRYESSNPLNPINRYNPRTPFAPIR